MEPLRRTSKIRLYTNNNLLMGLFVKRLANSSIAIFYDLKL